MTIEFKHHDALRLFVAVAHHSSFTAAAESLHLTKGAISSQIKNLEHYLDTKLFDRSARGITLTREGIQLLSTVQSHYRSIEADIAAIKTTVKQTLTVGMSTYFAARWLSPKLMTFMQQHPNIQLRIQPMTQLSELEGKGIDVAIRWGNGEWGDAEVEPVFITPAWPVGNPEAAKNVEKYGLEPALKELTLLHDEDNSIAWEDWFNIAGLPSHERNEALIIPDPNVRVQAVMDGQGIALMDALVANEIEKGKLVRFSNAVLETYGYFLVKPLSDIMDANVEAFIQWLKQQ